MANEDESRQSDLIALCTIMLALAVLATIMRFWSNYVVPNHKFGYDDLFALLALPFILGESSAMFYWIHIGLGRHAQALPLKHQLEGRKMIFIASFFYSECVCFPRYSALFFYHRVFQKTSRHFRYCLWIAGTLNTMWILATWLSTLFQCIPVHALWDPAAQAGARCFSTYGWISGTAISSMMIDLLILIMPLPLLWNLQASWKRRAIVCGYFIFGYGAVIVSIGRTVAINKAGPGLVNDLTWSSVPYIMWVQCEGPISVLSVSLPNIVALIRHVHSTGWSGLVRPSAGKVFNSTDSRGHKTSRNTEVEDTARFIRLETFTTVQYEDRDQESVNRGATQQAWSTQSTQTV